MPFRLIKGSSAIFQWSINEVLMETLKHFTFIHLDDIQYSSSLEEYIIYMWQVSFLTFVQLEKLQFHVPLHHSWAFWFPRCTSACQEKGCSRLATAHITPCCPTLSWFHKFLYGRNFIKGLNTTTPSQKCSWVPARHILDPELIRGVSSSFCDVFKMEI